MADPLSIRSYVANFFALSLDGDETSGYLNSVEGGGIKGELLSQQVGGQPHRFKHINNPTVEPVTLQVGMNMSDAFYKWVAASWAGECERRNGSIFAGDFQRQTRWEWQFQEALILETTMPALDAASKEAAMMTVKFQAETAKNALITGPTINAKAPTSMKLWGTHSFRATLDDNGLKLDCAKISKIDSFTVKQNAKPMACGPHWMYQIEPTSLEIPNVTFYLPQAHAGNFFAWHEDFVIKGNNNQKDEKSGSIEMFHFGTQKELLKIDLKQVGIVNITSEKAQAQASGQTAIRRVKVEMYVEDMAFSYRPQS